MYNYRVVPHSDDDIYESIYKYCNAKDENEIKIEEVLRHCKQDFDRLFMLHECSLFHPPAPLDSKLFDKLADEYYGLLDDFDIYFPSPEICGPKYSAKNCTKKDEVSYVYKNNQDSRITKFIPQFFGINYTNPDRNNNRGWRPSKNDRKIMAEHKKLYDILYSYCYPDGNSDRSSAKNQNNKLGNLAKYSIFRFDDNFENSYRSAFEHIRRGLIYRLSEDTPSKKIKASIYLDKFSSQIRSVSFSIVDKLIKEDLRKKSLTSHTDSSMYADCYANTCDYIIKRCSDLRHITIKESGKKDRTIVPIKMNMQDGNSVLHYAYIFFTNLPTIDYIEELKHFFSDPVSDINPIL